MNPHNLYIPYTPHSQYSNFILHTRPYIYTFPILVPIYIHSKYSSLFTLFHTLYSSTFPILVSIYNFHTRSYIYSPYSSLYTFPILVPIHIIPCRYLSIYAFELPLHTYIGIFSTFFHKQILWIPIT